MIRLKSSVIRLGLSVALLLCAVIMLKIFPSQVFSLMGSLTLYSVQSYLPVSGALVSFTEEEPVEAAEAEVTDKETTSKKTSAKVNNDLTAVDDDIEKLIKAAEKKASKDKKDGDIYEYTFTDDGATDSFGKVNVKNTNNTQIDIEEKLKEKLELKVNKKEPAVLIYHTHTTETYQLLDRDFYAQGFLSRSNDEARNMVRVGKAIATEIEKQGYKVIHVTDVYDNPYTGAYSRSREAVEAYLKKYPSIQITLDVHRDAIQNDNGVKTKPVATINGKKAAQIMLVSGCQEEGNGVTDLPEWEKNLAFALKLQNNMETAFEGLTRPVFFCDRSYNMGLTPCSLLVEVGTDANTLDEAVYSGKMVGTALAQILKEYEEN